MIEQKAGRERINRQTYATRAVARWYRDLDVVFKVEEVILQRLHPLLENRKLLDIGIGGGRTTGRLLKISKDYLGFDYTPRLAKIAKERHPQVTILSADARSLPLRDDAFEFALFSLNGLDSVDHDDRLKALSEIRRVLKPGGLYVFSTHNRDYQGFRKLPWQTNTLLSLSNLKSCLYTLVHWPRHLRLRKFESFNPEYAIVNDNAHGFSLLTYYISVGEQIKQLASAGFVEIEAYDMEGTQVQHDTKFPWTYFLARKPAPH